MFMFLRSPPETFADVDSCDKQIVADQTGCPLASIGKSGFNSFPRILRDSTSYQRLQLTHVPLLGHDLLSRH